MESCLSESLYRSPSHYNFLRTADIDHDTRQRPKTMSTWGEFFWLFQGHRWLFTVAIGLLGFLIGQFVTPFCRGFYWSDETINHPFAVQETFPNWSLVPIVLGPIVVYALVTYFFPRRRKMFPSNPRVPPHLHTWLEINQWALIQAQALVVHFIFVDTMKVYAGRLRPDFLNRLRIAGYSDPGTGLMQYMCSESMSNSQLRDGHLSFPSGHSSTSFGSMVPLCLFLAYHLRPWFYGCFIRFVICITPLYLAFFVAISRTRDNRHNFSDILAGGLIGALAGVGAFWVNLHYSKERGEFEVRSAYVSLEEGAPIPMMPLAPAAQS